MLFTVSLRSRRGGRSNLVNSLKRLLRHPILWGFLVMTVLNIFFSLSPFLSIYKWLKFFEFLALTIWIKNNFKKEWLPDFLKVVFFTVIFQSVVGSLQFIKQSSLGLGLYFLGERTFNPLTPGIALGNYVDRLLLRPYGTLPHPNVYAAVLLFYSIFLIYYFKKSAINMLALVVSTTAIVLSVSRLAMMGLAVTVAGVFVPKHISKAFGLIYIFAILFIFVSVDPSVAIRENLNSSTVKIVKENLIFGSGLGTNILALQKYSSDIYFNSQPLAFLQPVHNVYLMILSETGILGFIFSTYFIYKLYNLVKKIMFLKLLILLILFISFFDHYFMTLQSGQLLLSLVLGIILACQKSSGLLPPTPYFKSLAK